MSYKNLSKVTGLKLLFVVQFGDMIAVLIAGSLQINMIIIQRLKYPKFKNIVLFPK